MQTQEASTDWYLDGSSICGTSSGYMPVRIADLEQDVNLSSDEYERNIHLLVSAKEMFDALCNIHNHNSFYQLPLEIQGIVKNALI